MTTVSLSLPRAAAEKASIARASANGFAPRMSVGRRPAGRATSPTRITCAPPTAFAPVGASAPRASSLAVGRSGPFEYRMGARIVVPASTDAATPMRQSRTSTSATAPGRVFTDRPGKTARAPPAASAIGSAPPTRVVFFVANAGKPRLPAASDWLPLAPTVGVVTVRAPTPPRFPPQAAAVSAHSARTAIRSARRRIQSRKIASGAQMNDDVYSSSMDFRLSDEQLAFQRHCHAFARDVMRPAAARYDREQSVPYEVVREARARGLHGMPYLERVE